MRPRNGPPEAVRTSESTVSGACPRGTGRAPSARCRPGSSSPPPRCRAASASSPAATRLSLFASASVTPRSSAHSVAPTPAKPTTAFRTTSGSARSSSSVEIAADLDVLDAERRREVVERLRARTRARRRASSGCAAIDLERLAADRSGRAEEGDSSLAHGRRLTAPVFRHGYALPKREDREVRGRAGPEQRVEPVEHAAVPAEQAPGVLDARGRASPPTRRGRRATAASAIDEPEQRATRGIVRNVGSVLVEDRRTPSPTAASTPPTNPSHDFSGRDRRRQLVPSERASDEERAPCRRRRPRGARP